MNESQSPQVPSEIEELLAAIDRECQPVARWYAMNEDETAYSIDFDWKREAERWFAENPNASRGYHLVEREYFEPSQRLANRAAAVIRRLRASTGRQPEALTDERCDQCDSAEAPMSYTYRDGGAWHINKKLCVDCFREQRPDEYRALASTEAPAEAKALYSPDDMLFYGNGQWDAGYEAGRADEITSRKALEKGHVERPEAPVVRDSEGPREEPQSTAGWEREAFEKWKPTSITLKVCEESEYINLIRQAAWEAWQGRASITGAQPLQEKT